MSGGLPASATGMRFWGPAQQNLLAPCHKSARRVGQPRRLVGNVSPHRAEHGQGLPLRTMYALMLRSQLHCRSTRELQTTAFASHAL